MKNYNLKSKVAVFLLFSMDFIIGPISYQKKLFQNFGCLYLGQQTAGEATFASPVHYAEVGHIQQGLGLPGKASL